MPPVPFLTTLMESDLRAGHAVRTIMGAGRIPILGARRHRHVEHQGVATIVASRVSMILARVPQASPHGASLGTDIREKYRNITGGGGSDGCTTARGAWPRCVRARSGKNKIPLT